MRRYIAYYRRIFKTKYLFFKYGRRFKVSLIDRLLHNCALCRLKIATPLAKSIFEKDGSYKQIPYDENLDYLNLVEEYKTRHTYYLEYWIANDIKIVPEKDMRIFLACAIS